MLFLKLEKMFENICFKLSTFIFFGGIPNRICVLLLPSKRLTLELVGIFLINWLSVTNISTAQSQILCKIYMCFHKDELPSAGRGEAGGKQKKYIYSEIIFASQPSSLRSLAKILYFQSF